MIGSVSLGALDGWRFGGSSCCLGGIIFYMTKFTEIDFSFQTCSWGQKWNFKTAGNVAKMFENHLAFIMQNLCVIKKKNLKCNKKMTGAESKFGSLQLLSLFGPGKRLQQKSKSLSMMERKCLVAQVANVALAMEIKATAAWTGVIWFSPKPEVLHRVSEKICYFRVVSHLKEQKPRINR